MIRYIFNNRIKNGAVMLLSVVLMYPHLYQLGLCLTVSAWIGAAVSCVQLLPCALIVGYMLTLTRDYALKSWLFPIAFATWSVLALFESGGWFSPYAALAMPWQLIQLLNLAVSLFAIVGYACCLVGSLANFKRLPFLRVGLVLVAVSALMVAVAYYGRNAWIWEGSGFNEYRSEMANALWRLVFCAALFAVSVTKKSEDRALAPFEEARRLKKERKRDQRAAQEPEDNTPTAVEEGQWRCMGCGNVLPNNQERCTCGYKRT